MDAALVVGIIGVLVALAAWLRPRPVPVQDGETPSLRARIRAKLRPQELAILPVYFEIKLNQPKPDVRVTVYAVNHLWREVILDEVRVESLQLSRAESVEDLIVTNLPVPGRQQRLITCRRVLVESEIQSFLTVPNEERYQASMRVSAKGRAGWGKRVTFNHLLSFSIQGWLERPASKAADARGQAFENDLRNLTPDECAVLARFVDGNVRVLSFLAEGSGPTSAAVAQALARRGHLSPISRRDTMFFIQIEYAIEQPTLSFLRQHPELLRSGRAILAETQKENAQS